MKREVKLFLAGQEVEFKSIPDILYNFKVDDITSPAAVKNSYSKSVTIPSTPSNNKIFGGFYNNDFEGVENGNYYGVGFDPRKRMPFVITVNGETYETGYARLDKVTQNKGYYEYSLSLFGGLGDFFYELEYGEDAGKRKMSSLIFRKSGTTSEELELDFTINAETLYNAWVLSQSDNDKFGVINFAPCYDGIPSNFSADKVLVNYSGITSEVAKLGYSSVTEDGKTYTTYNKYYLAELPKAYTQAEMREYRSWMQRPVLRVRKAIEAICLPENNGGYTVTLDPDFFNSGNSYYQAAFVTLPLLSEIKSTDYSTFDDYSVHTFTKNYTFSFNADFYALRLVFDPVIPANASKIQMNLELLMSAQTSTLNAQTLYTSAMIENISEQDASHRNFSGALWQLRAYAGDGPQSSTIGYSEAVLCTSQMANGDFLHIEETFGNTGGADVKYSLGKFDLVDPAKKIYKWSQQFTLTMDIPAGTKSIALTYQPLANLTSGISSIDGSVYQTYGYRRRKGYTSTYLNESTNTNTCYLDANFTVEMSGSTTSMLGDAYAYLGEGRTMGYTGAYITKNMLLDTDYSPCDFLLSYAKLFGLYFVKDPIEKEISVLTRANFFHRSNITDISNYVDRTSVEIKPLSFDSKWYNWGLEAVDSEFEKMYESAYGKKYGDMDVNTGYEFSTDAKNVLEGNIFRSCVEALERSNQFYTVGTNDWSRPWMHSSYKYNLYNVNDMEDAKEITIPRSTTVNRVNLQLDYNFYDLFSKPVFHNEENKPSDGKNVLLIEGDTVQVGSYNSTGLKAYITDDVPEMGVLNSNEACWLYTQGGTRQHPEVYGAGGNIIARRIQWVPHFSRFVVNSGSTYIARSFNFGVPETIYVPGIDFSSAATMYNFFWREYMEEIFSKNSRVMKCKMLITEKPSVEWLRRFYYFDNTIWRMTSINDWNISSDKLTEVEFVRVKNITKYTSENPTNYTDIYLSVDSNTVSLNGGTIGFHIRTLSPDIHWVLSCPPDCYTYEQDMQTEVASGDGDFDGYIVIPSNEQRIINFYAISSVYFDGEIINQEN